MSVYARPDLAALAELEQLVARLGDELAGWRRRCLTAEADLKRARGGSGPAGPELDASRDRVEQLEAENAELRRRLEVARERVRGLAGRVHLVGRGAPGGAG